MKKILFVASAALLSCWGLSSCNNGAYDAQPKGSGSSLNPLNPNSGVTVYIGTMKGTFNYHFIRFYPADYAIDEPIPQQPRYTLQGMKGGDTLTKNTVTIVFNEYKGVKKYIIDADSTNVLFAYSHYDTSARRISFYTANTAAGRGHIELNVKGEEGGNLRGTFSGTVYRTLPTLDLKDSVVITDGEFYVPKAVPQ